LLQVYAPWPVANLPAFSFFRRFFYISCKHGQCCFCTKFTTPPSFSPFSCKREYKTLAPTFFPSPPCLKTGRTSSLALTTVVHNRVKKLRGWNLLSLPPFFLVPPSLPFQKITVKRFWTFSFLFFQQRERRCSCETVTTT